MPPTDIDSPSLGPSLAKDFSSGGTTSPLTKQVSHKRALLFLGHAPREEERSQERSGGSQERSGGDEGAPGGDFVKRGGGKPPLFPGVPRGRPAGVASRRQERSQERSGGSQERSGGKFSILTVESGGGGGRSSVADSTSSVGASPAPSSALSSPAHSVGSWGNSPAAAAEHGNAARLGIDDARWVLAERWGEVITGSFRTQRFISWY
ncbi:hypothetical protein T484DRAFT_2361036 [Baffinella frigidus]|nr:hypothetical protein T484DRAFT_2361036 [Cryptophyta sp. CCMP2293]